MLEEEDYSIIDPTEFHYTGTPLPARDGDAQLSANTIFPTREDAAYITEWTYRFRRMFQYPSAKKAWLVNKTDPVTWLYGANAFGGGCWQTPYLNAHLLQMVDDTTGMCYKQSLDDCWFNGCAMTLSAPSIWSNIRSLNLVPIISSTSPLEEVIPLSCRLTQAELSTCISGVDNYEGGYGERNLVMPDANALRKLYWDLNNICCVATTNTGLYIGNTQKRANTREWVLSSSRMWPDDLTETQGVTVAGCLAQKGSSCKKTTEMHFIALKDDQLVLSSTTLTSVLKYTGATTTYITSGDNLPTICLNGSWCDPSTLRLRSTILLNTWYQTTGKDEWQLAPTLSGNVTAMGVLLKGDVSWSAYDISSDISSMEDLSADGDDPRVWHDGSSRLWMWLSLAKSGSVFSTNSTRLTQSKFLSETLIRTKLLRMLGDDVRLQYFSWHFTDTEATVMQISDKAHIDGWAWVPPLLSAQLSAAPQKA